MSVIYAYSCDYYVSIAENHPNNDYDGYSWRKLKHCWNVKMVVNDLFEIANDSLLKLKRYLLDSKYYCYDVVDVLNYCYQIY